MPFANKMQTKYAVVVIFSGERRPRRVSLLRAAWAWLTLPPRWFGRQIPRLIGDVTGSTLGHVAIGTPTGVLSPTASGDSFFCPLAYLRTRRVSSVVWIWAPKPMRLEPPHYTTVKSRSALPSIIRWLCRGWTPANNCVTVAADRLRDAGVPIPRRINTPDELMAVLRRTPDALVMQPKEAYWWMTL